MNGLIGNMPHDKDIEHALLGSMMLAFNEKPKLKDKFIAGVLEHINENDFYDEIHKPIFRVIKASFENQKNLDIILLHQKAKDILKNECPSPSFFIGIIEKTQTIANIKDYALTVKNLSLNRQQIKASITYAQDIKDGKPPNEATEKLQQTINSINRERNPKGPNTKRLQTRKHRHTRKGF